MREIIVPTEQAAAIGNQLHQACQQLRTHLAEAAEGAAKQVEAMKQGYMVSLQWVTGPAARAAEYQGKVQTLTDVALMLGLTQDDVQAAYTHTDGLFWFTTAQEHAEREARRAARTAK